MNCSTKVVRSTRGFTLVELLVALTISAIVILAAFAASRSGWWLWRRVENRRPTEQIAGQIISTMRSEWGGLYWPAAEGAESPFSQMESKNGGEQKVSFCTTMPGYYRGVAPGRCARVTYEFRMDATAESAGGVLIRREQMLAGEQPIAEPIADVVATGLNSFALECLDKSGKPYQSGGGQSAEPPRMVKVTMSWLVPNAAGGEPEPTTFSAQFPIFCETSLMPSDSGEDGGP